MSENKITTIPDPVTDLSPTDIQLVNKFKEDGLPGLAALEDSAIARIMDAYLEGKTYSQIANIMRVSRSLVMYLSDRFGWYQRRKELQDEIAAQIQRRLVEQNLKTQDFLIQLIQFLQRRLSKKMAKYYETGNDDVGAEVNHKEIDRLVKSIKALQELDTSGKGPKTGKPPAVGLNLPSSGITVERKDDGSVEITPKEKAHGDLLQRYADFRRQQDANRTKKRSDIEEVTPTTTQSEGEKVDENS